MKKTFAVLNQMVKDGAIENYAVAGAIGAVFYVEPFSTKDINVFVITPDDDRLVIELPGWEYLKAHGYDEISKEGIMIEGWPVQFMPVANPLEREAYENAKEKEVDEVRVRVALPEHLVAIMLSVGRLKDLARIEMFLAQRAVDLESLADILDRHGLSEKFEDYKRKLRL